MALTKGDLPAGTQVILADVDLDVEYNYPVGYVAEPTERDIEEGFSERGTDVEHCTLIMWPRGTRWEYPDDLVLLPGK